MIDFRTFPEIVKAAKENAKLKNKAYAAEGHGTKRFDSTNMMLRNHTLNVYARIVYETLKPLNPTMIDIRHGGKLISFIDAYGVTWEEVVKRNLTIVFELAEDGLSPYEFEETVISVNGKVKDTVFLLNPENEVREIEVPRKP